MRAARLARILTIAIAIAIAIAPGAAFAQGMPAESAVRRAVQDLLDSWREADAAKGDAVLHPQFRITTRRDNFASDDTERHGTPPFVSVADRAAMMRIYANLRPGSWDDRLSGISIRVDPSGVAHLWGRYRFSMDGRLSHCGVAAFTLYRLGGRWQIIEFADTHHWAEPGEQGGCSPPRAP